MVIETINQIQLNHTLAEAMRASRRLLDLADDWDEEGSPSFREATWRRATEFVKLAAGAFQQRFGVWVEPPRILPGPEGSIMEQNWRSIGIMLQTYYGNAWIATRRPSEHHPAIRLPHQAYRVQ